ncbi:hypothetical protein JCM10207_002210 [Rhodosporidiobolus poonsookiae]
MLAGRPSTPAPHPHALHAFSPSSSASSSRHTMPAFSPLSSGPSSASSSSKSSTSSGHSPSVAYPMTRRDSTYSLYSTSSSDEAYSTDDFSDDDELATPDCSPELRPVADPSGKGKGKAIDLTASFHAFSLSEIPEDDASPPEWDLPTSAIPLPTPQPQPLPTAVAPSPSSALPYTPSAAFRHAAPDPDASARPAPQPSPPSPAVADPDAPRGRSRWPRLLWRSELDVDSLAVLRNYHERAVGKPLPRLRRGMDGREVERWSRRMEDVGL